MPEFKKKVLIVISIVTNVEYIKCIISYNGRTEGQTNCETLSSLFETGYTVQKVQTLCFCMWFSVDWFMQKSLSQGPSIGKCIFTALLTMKEHLNWLKWIYGNI